MIFNPFQGGLFGAKPTGFGTVATSTATGFGATNNNFFNKPVATATGGLFGNTATTGFGGLCLFSQV